VTNAVSPSLGSSPEREQFSVVMVGHVDHGKSTVIGRLLADTDSLPQGKLEQVKALCQRTAKPFEYAFLLDALKDEQAQGITIDTARCFFKSASRDYILIDAPGHVEFLKNMVTGAARAEAAMLVIDAHEGVKENSRRHGYLLSLLGVRQIVVLVNKMDLVNNDPHVFEKIKEDYSAFLSRIGVFPTGFVPVVARDGINIVQRGAGYTGKTVLEHLDAFRKSSGLDQKPFRFPLQDVYKFTEENDERRILAGTVETGVLNVGDPVVFFPSGKKSTIKTIEAFNRSPQNQTHAGETTGVTLTEEIYVRPGELMFKDGDTPPLSGSRFRANLFWLGRAPLVKDKRYKLKLAAARVPVRLVDVLNVLDAGSMTLETGGRQVERHEVAECLLETGRPVAFDLALDNPATGRFVIVDDFEIAGGGIVLEATPTEGGLVRDHVSRREASWERGAVSLVEREKAQGHRAKFVVLTGDKEDRLRALGKKLERRLFERGHRSYYLAPANVDQGLDSDVMPSFDRDDTRWRFLGELGRFLTEGGHLVITPLANAEEADLLVLKELNRPQEVLVLDARTGVWDSAQDDETVVSRWVSLLRERDILPDFMI